MLQNEHGGISIENNSKFPLRKQSLCGSWWLNVKKVLMKPRSNLSVVAECYKVEVSGWIMTLLGNLIETGTITAFLVTLILYFWLSLETVRPTKVILQNQDA